VVHKHRAAVAGMTVTRQQCDTLESMSPVGVADEDVGRGSGDPPHLAFCKAGVLL